MKAYVDSSVLLRVVFGEKSQLDEWSQLEHVVCSSITRVECLRTIDRMRLRLQLSDKDVSYRHTAVFSVLKHMDVIDLSSTVLDRASQPFPTMLGTLDAIHLASALAWQSDTQIRLLFLTHDQELGRAARAMNFEVLGC